MYTSKRLAVVLSLTWVAGCSSGGGSGDPVADNGNDELPAVSDVIMAPAGEITHYGAVTVADDAGQASDLVGSFYRLASGVSAEFMTDMLAGNTAMCQVQDDGVIDFEEISVVYVPSVPGINATAVSAGEALVLSGPDGTYATLEEQPAGGFLFYDLPSMSMLMDGPVPTGLLLDVPGSAEIPAIVEAAVPEVTTLANAEFGGENTVSSSSTFTWDASDDPGAMIRIFTSTAGGFFLEDGVTVSCVAPDTGSFTFPADVRRDLGADFIGSAPLMSRIVVNPVQVDSTVVYVIRESFR